MSGLFGSVLWMKQFATPTRNPSSGSNFLYFKSDGLLYSKDSGGVERVVAPTGVTHHASRANAASTSHTHNTETTIPWATANVLDGITYASNTFTVPAAGRYSIDAALLFASSATGVRRCSIVINGTLVRFGPNTAGASGTSTGCNVSATLKLAAGDTIQISGFQNSGAALALVASATANYVEISYVGPAAP